ncbi:hypothetical protein M569_00730, partial [Genlisea aurea]
PFLLPEIGPDGLARESPVIAYTEKAIFGFLVIEEEQLQLRKYIEENYSKIRDVEREFANLNMEMKLTSGPKKAALELMRKKIEAATERIRIAKLKEVEASKAWEAAAKAVRDEEAAKQKLCEDLNNLVVESSNSQMSRLEELKRKLEALNPTRSSSTAIPSVINQESSSISNTSEAPTGQTKQASTDGEGRRKKQTPPIHGKFKALGAVPKGSKGSGWTGAGFDVDGRS